MKKILSIMCAMAMVLSMASCGSQKKVAEQVEVNIPLSGSQYRTDADFFRAVQSGESTNDAMAKKIAIQNARQELGAAIKAELEGVIENFGKEQAVDSLSEYKAQYSELMYTAVKETLVGATVVDEKLFKQANGKYKHYVCLQLAKEDIKKEVEKAISVDEKLKLEFELEQFKKVYDEQMKKYQAENK